MPFINGFSAFTSPSRTGVKTYRVPGTGTYLPVKAEVAPLLIGFAKEFHEKVEPLRTGWCWGWAYRPIRFRSSISFHAGGLAIDLNAPRHPLGRRGTFSRRQVAIIRALCRKYGLRWGGDYRGRKDEMHFEVIVSRSRALELVRRLQRKPVRKPTLKRRVPRYARLRYGQANADIAMLRLRLYKLGYPVHGEKGNYYGPKTKAAVARFQKNRGWSGRGADGLMGPLTYQRLFGVKPK